MAIPTIDYIILAEFDIEKGSSVRFQYPMATKATTQYVRKNI
jgi:hypothetical protein